MAKAEKSKSAKADERGAAGKGVGRKKASDSSNSGQAPREGSKGKRISGGGKEALKKRSARAEAAPSGGAGGSESRTTEKKRQKIATGTAAPIGAPEPAKPSPKRKGEALPPAQKAGPARRRQPPAGHSSLTDPQPGDVLHRREVVEVTTGWVHYRITGSSDLKEMPKRLWPVLAKHPPLGTD